jgi:uncharacterized protein YjbJ (UPF0337 family)
MALYRKHQILSTTIPYLKQRPIHTSTARMSSDDQNAPSMLGGHAQYAKGYVSETIGNMTGSDAWKESGKQDSQAGIEQMKVRRRSTFSCCCIC